MMPNISNLWPKKRPKSSAPDPCPPGTFPIVDHVPQPYTTYQPHLPQPFHQHQQQLYQHHQQAIQMQLSPFPPPFSPQPLCPFQCQPQQQQQQQIIQSPQQPIACPMQNQFRNNTFGSSGLSETYTNNITLPAYQSNQIQSPIAGGQSPRCSDNSYYMNQHAPSMLQHQQQQQQHQQHQQHHSLDEQRPKEQQQQHQYQHQPNQQFIPQQHFESQQRQALQDHQQNYQNAPIPKLSDPSDGDFSLEVKCIMYEKSKNDLLEHANKLKDDLSKLKEELEVIRKETPVYSVCELKI